MSFSHPDDEYREDLLGEAAFYALLEEETLEPLWTARTAFAELPAATERVILSEQTIGLNG